MVKTTLAAYLISYKLNFFEILIMILEPLIRLITAILDQDKTGIYFQRVFRVKDPPLYTFSQKFKRQSVKQ